MKKAQLLLATTGRVFRFMVLPLGMLLFGGPFSVTCERMW
jgi:hypothetical protein